jgi:hypothetical protein
MDWFPHPAEEGRAHSFVNPIVKLRPGRLGSIFNPFARGMRMGRLGPNGLAARWNEGQT